MAKLPYISLIQVTGGDARRFLHAQLSADIESLAEGSSIFACLCLPNGRVKALLLVHSSPEGFSVLCGSDLVEDLVQWLQRFVFRDDVQFKAARDLSVAGDLGETSASAMSVLPGLNYSIIAADDELADDNGQFHAAELTAGVVWLDSHSTETFLPQMLGASSIGALNFRKGCYPGQEIVARTHYLGKVKQRPLLFKAQGHPAIPTMTRLTLKGEEQEAQIMILDSAPLADGQVQVASVVRCGEPFDAQCLSGDSNDWAIQGLHWPELPQASATT